MHLAASTSWLLGILFVLVLVVGIGAFFGAPYVPTKRRDLRRMFRHYGLSADDVVLDLGSGDGVVLRQARRFGARAVGFELNPVLYAVSRFLCRHDSSITIRLTNAWTEPFPDDTTVVYIFSVHRDGPKLEKRLQHEAQRLGRPLTLVCYGNPLPHVAATSSFEAYWFYSFQPLHPPQA